ncbi:uncharacterized protein BCR38DRAFT_447870 [Pseudomassariella vexata]|uniref:C2H2-type domain-containing protein n=1 Tax=Pseudomassariella vexata TaxID=1141098 RepID=A0A1Y2DG20_9PEZI|nr:uncharacterized protein BCR38DRAFT_447870 [Pseudomassariella vexata]ORY58056.1 hypothetical protein BCR38DRAFT_447870 [Pseudomassariella vexata]
MYLLPVNLEKPTHMYDAMWPKSKQPTGQTKIIIAALFEDCSQNFNKLCALLVPHCRQVQNKSLADCLSHFITWGIENSAKDLDYKLRKAGKMHDMVVDLLTQLKEALEEGLQILETDELQDIEDKVILPDDSLHGLEDVSGVTLDEVSPESRNKDSGLVDSAGEIFEIIETTVDDLKSLTPSLVRPYPEDIDTLSSSVADSSDTGDVADVELARRVFPSASSVLHARLGHANWKRKIAQRTVQLNTRHGGFTQKQAPRGERKTVRQEVAVDAFNFQRPTLGMISGNIVKTSSAKANPGLPIPSTASSTAPSEMGGTATASIAPSAIFSQTTEAASISIAPSTIFSRGKLTRAGSTTTLETSSSIHKSSNALKQMKPRVAPVERPKSRVMTYPAVPVELEGIVKGKEQQFTCNLCGYDLEAGTKIKTEDDWKQHVLEDLEPYLCTFDECFSAQEMYAIRDEWYQHELETHRVKKVWKCAACSEEFTTKSLVEEHLESHGPELDQDEIFMMKAMLRQTLSNKHFGTSNFDCPLCRIKVSSGKTKDHIARHLEFFALLSVLEEESSEDDSDEMFSQTNDDAMSDRYIRETVLSTFVKEQLKLNLERGKQPPDRFMEDGNFLDLLEDMSDYDGSKDSRSSPGGRRDESKNLLMERMFHGERSRNQKLPFAPASRSTQSLLNAAGASPLTSSTERLPLLRTWSYPRNDDFMGRDKDLAKLYKILSEPGTVCVVSAEGGMGKTALAVEYSWRYEHCYHYVFWIQTETPVGSADTFCQIAIQLGLASEGMDNDILIKIGREFLEQVKDKRWLMVFDNVNKWEDIDSFTPIKTSATNGSILITTRHESLTAPSRPVNYYRWALEELDVDEGRKLLIHGLPQELRPEENSLRDPEYKIAGDIATLAGLPLLIIYISGYVKQAGCSLSEFWEYWDEWRPNARKPGGSTDASGRDSVFHIALRDLGGDARKILKIMAFLNSDGIQRELLVRIDNNKPGPAYLKQNRFRLIMSKLITQKFVAETTTKHADKETYTVHRVLQSRLLQDMKAKPHERDEMYHIAYELVRHHLPRPSMDSPELSKWSTSKEYLPHVLSLQHAYADPFSIASPKPFLGLAELFKDGGVLLWQRYIYSDAMKLLDSAEKILDELESEEENLRAEINVTINLLLQYFGISHRKESKERLGRILEYRQKIMDKKAPEDITREDQILLIDAKADYANGLLQFNDYKAAEPIYQDCYKRYLELGAESEPKSSFALAKLNHHMAYCKMYRREFAEATKLAEKAVGIIDALGDRQMTLRYQFDEACIVLQSGDLERALTMHREILDARLGFQGRASYFSLQSQYAYAALCHYLGRLQEAEGWMMQALSKASERGGKNFWPDAALARTKFHLSQVLTDLNGGEPTERSLQMARDAKDMLSRMLPYDPVTGVREEHTGALFDHLQPVFEGRFTGLSLLEYVS